MRSACCWKKAARASTRPPILSARRLNNPPRLLCDAPKTPAVEGLVLGPPQRSSSCALLGLCLGGMEPVAPPPLDATTSLAGGAAGGALVATGGGGAGGSGAAPGALVEYVERPVRRSAPRRSLACRAALRENARPPPPVARPPQGRTGDAVKDLEAKLDYIQKNVPTVVHNVMGSCAGAGSGEFHTYRMQRRREMFRLERMEAEAAKEQEQTEFEERQAKRAAEADARTSKKRAKRQRKKENREAREGKAAGPAAGPPATAAAEPTEGAGDAADAGDDLD